MYLDGISTERLYFRKLSISDIADWKEFFNDKEMLRFIGFNKNVDNFSHSKKWIEKQLWRYEHDQFGHHALIDKKTNNLVGQCGLLTQNVNGKDEIEIGYHILPSYCNCGYATEAAMKVRDYAFKKLDIASLISIIHKDNIASSKVAEKIGMKQSEEVKDFPSDLLSYGSFVIYRIDKKIWENIK